MLPSNWYENSACNGCEYGERITAGVFCSELQELVPVGYVGCKAERDYYEEIDKMENGITLTELAHELRKIFKFDILTYSAYEDCDCYATYQKESIILWQRNSPEALPEYDATGFYFDVDGNVYALFEILNMGATIAEILDLSEYKDADGNIDYSKCIVEVANDIN